MTLPRYAVGIDSHRTLDGAARALLDCSGNCPPVEVLFGDGTRRPLNQAELKRLGAAVTEQRATHHKQAQQYEPTDLARLMSVLREAA